MVRKYKTEPMIKKLKEELRILATDIITSNAKDSRILGDQARLLYEKLTILQYIETHKESGQRNNSPAPLTKEVLKPDSQIVNEVAATNHAPSLEREKVVDQVLEDFLGSGTVMKNDKETVTPNDFKTKKVGHETQVQQEEPQSLNDRLAATQVKIGLNDRLAFVKHLFKNRVDDYNWVLSQLNTFSNQEESVEFIETLVRPEYDNWEGKEEYADRFMQLIERRFS